MTVLPSRIHQLESRSTVRTAASICVVNFNGAPVVRDTLRAIYDSAGEIAEVLLVDNASDDGSAEIIEQEFSDVQLIRLPENRGPGAARNAGFAAASSDRVLFLDNDVVLAPDCLSEVMRALDERSDAVIAMPRVLYRRDPTTIQYDGGGAHFLGLMSLEHADHPVEEAPSHVREIDSLVSACFLVDRSRWRGGPLFDEEFFIYLEDHDLGMRARIAGGTVLSVPAAICFHGEGTQGLSLRSTGRYQPLRIRGNIRNRWLILLKNYQLRTLLLLAPALSVFELFQLAGVAKKGWFREWWQSAGWMVTNRALIRDARRAVQSRRRTRDRELLRGDRIPFAAELTGDGLERVGRVVLDAFCGAYWSGVRRFL